MATDKGAMIKETNLSSTTLFVRNLPFFIDNKELEAVFSDVGPVKRCFVVKDKANPNQCRGFGYVTFALKEDAIQAQEKIRQIKGRKLFITFSNKKPRHNPRGPPEKNDEAKGSDNKDKENTENIPMETIPSTTPQQHEKPKHKPKSKRSSAMSNDGRTVVLTGFSSTFKIKQLKKACKRSGEIEQFIYPVETDSQPTAHAVYKSHKVARKAVNYLNGKTVKGEVLMAVLRSKEDKNLSQKSLKKSRLIVRNLPFKCSKELLTNKFSKFGEISEIVMPTKTVGKNKKKLGFAFVQFKNVFDAAKALEGMNQKEIKGRPIAVDWTLPKKKYELLKVSEEVPKVLDDENEQNDDVISEQSEEPSDQDDGDDGSYDDGGSDDGENDDGSDDDGDDDDDGNDDGDDDDGSDDGGDDDDDGNDDGDDDDDDDDGNDDDGSEGDDHGGGSDDERPKKKKRKLRDAREGRTIFIRNLPFDASEEEICDMFEKFGEIAYCKIVVDSVTGHSRGSAFVKFQEKQSADDCLKKHGDKNDSSEELIMRKRPLDVTLAVTKGKVPQLLAEKDTTKKTPRDKRNLYLAKEGVIVPGSEAAVGLSKSDLQKRQKAEEEKKGKLKMPHYIVSKTRLCLRNLPLNIDDRKLSEVLRTVCDGKPKTVRKVRIMRNMDRLDSSGVGRSKGFGFAEFTSHQDALEVLRTTNNNPAIFGPDRRPIVEFAIENSLILQRLEQRKTKNLQKVKPRESNSEVNTENTKRKRERSENSKRKRVRKDENANESVGNSARTTETVSSNADSSSKLEQNLNVSKFNSSKKNQGRNKAKNKASKSQDFEPNTGNKTARDYNSEKLNSRAQMKKEKTDWEEEKFNKIVEKYKTKLFGENTKQLKASRWFDA